MAPAHITAGSHSGFTKQWLAAYQGLEAGGRVDSTRSVRPRAELADRERAYIPTPEDIP